MKLNNILSHIRREIQDLEMNGIQVEGYGTIKGTIICTSHDNLAAHMLFCMILGFRGRYCCRFCKITVDDSLMATKEEKELLRVNIENDIENAMDENGRVTDHHKSYGFTGKSELLKLNYFKIETGSSVDPFHDLLEGIVPRDLKHVFSYMIRNMKVSEQHIGDLIHAFKFGILSNSHKPANVKLAKDSHRNCRKFVRKQTHCSRCQHSYIGLLTKFESKFVES